jgi:alkanesulfonate monooxygenase SsuD/methylene tetrahydromethanopterin reductase-like flavin-dependent oxidoreductase (luciferase family)
VTAPSPERSRISLGLRGSIGAAAVGEVAALAEEAGFRGLWVSDSVEGDALDALEAAAARTSRLRLATGVLPLDRRPADGILPRLAALPAERSTIGVGAGAPTGALDRVTRAVETLRAGCAAEIAVGALGPQMRRLAARHADVVLYNWLTPSALVDVVADLRRDAEGRAVRSALYLRTIVDLEARPALLAELARKAGKASYATNVDALDGDPFSAALDATTDPGQRLAEFAASVDEPVLRLIVANPTQRALLAAVERLAARLPDQSRPA